MAGDQSVRRGIRWKLMMTMLGMMADAIIAADCVRSPLICAEPPWPGRSIAKIGWLVASWSAVEPQHSAVCVNPWSKVIGVVSAVVPDRMLERSSEATRPA